MTRAEIAAEPWIGEQRQHVLELLDRAERAEARAEALNSQISSLVFALQHDGLTADARCGLAVRLCEGTSMKVVVR